MRAFQVSPGMAKSVFENKYARRKLDGSFQNWEERITEVVRGNFSLVRDDVHNDPDYERTLELAVAGVIPLSGRHLQHGDENQKDKIGEIFTNCSSAMFSFVKFWLLLKGSGVGRCYDADICRVNWDNMPEVRFVMEGPEPDGTGGHPDYEDWIETKQAALHKYDSESEDVRWFEVEDSAEGWVKVVEILETAAYQEKHRHKLFIFDFSLVRERGAPIKGQQGRPSSGPVPFIKSLHRVVSIRGAGMKPWKQAMFVDHFLSSCVAVGGIRRSARIAVKNWRERDIFEFIDIKRGGWLYTANNTVGVDKEFWELAQTPAPSHARRVFEAMCSASYFDKTGEPAFLNLDKLSWSDEGIDNITPENYVGSLGKELLKLHPRTIEMIGKTLERAKQKPYPVMVNPCGEIVFAVYGAYCIVGDLCLANAASLDEAIDGARLTSKALMRVNTMPFLYKAEVDRTDRIGTGLTGIFEFAYKFFKYTFFDLLDEAKSQDFWNFVARMREEVRIAVTEYAEELGVAVPHTWLTMKPSGTISKVMSCTEGGHIPPYAYFLRWVQYPKNDPAVEAHRKRGYPVKDVSHQYKDHVVVGFPTKMPIADLMGDDVVTMGDVTPEDQYRWLELLEKYWLGDGENNQISYTLKYDPTQVDYLDYMEIIKTNQSKVRACSIMPQIDSSAYAYLPEEAISREEYESLVASIKRFNKEGYDAARLECENNHCPIDPDIHDLEAVRN